MGEKIPLMIQRPTFHALEIDDSLAIRGWLLASILMIDYRLKCGFQSIIKSQLPPKRQFDPSLNRPVPFSISIFENGHFLI